MKNPKLISGVFLAAAVLAALAPALASELKLPEEIGRIESPRDMNLLQVEPTVIDENYYSSGRVERHQFIGSTLPAGAPVPDTDYPVPVTLPAAPKPDLTTAPQTVPAGASVKPDSER
jgi:hypothetical protein